MSDPRTRYVVGFAFDSRGRVALIRKKRPTWQAGLLNGIGGHVEDREKFVEAMAREFLEEAGVWQAPSTWRPFCTLVGGASIVQFYAAFLVLLDLLRTTTDEQVVVRDVSQPRVYQATLDECVPNLRWLIPMAQERTLDATVVDTKRGLG